MKILSAEEQRKIADTLSDHKEAVGWAFETTKRILKAGITIDFWGGSSERGYLETRSLGPWKKPLSMLRDIEEENRNRYRLKILGKDFNIANKEDRARISGFLDHFEMNEEDRKEKEVRAREVAERKARKRMMAVIKTQPRKNRSS